MTTPLHHLTTEQIAHVNATLNQIEDQNAFVTTFYEELFQRYPQVKPLFNAQNMAEQRMKLLMTLIFAVENLQQPDEMRRVVRSLGERHLRAYGVLPEHFPMVGEALLTALERHLGPAWTPETAQAWAQTYQAIADIMLG